MALDLHALIAPVSRERPVYFGRSDELFRAHGAFPRAFVNAGNK